VGERDEKARERVENLVANDPHLRGDGLRDQLGGTPSLEAQTPGLDPERPVRDAALRLLSWARERPGVALLVGGALLALLVAARRR
jgi:hypothetical protein